MKNANKFHNLIWKLKAGVSVAKPEPPGAAIFRAAPGETVLEPIFLVGRNWEPKSLLKRLRCIFQESKKEKPCSCIKHEFSSIHKDKWKIK